MVDNRMSAASPGLKRARQLAWIILGDFCVTSWGLVVSDNSPLRFLGFPYLLADLVHDWWFRASQPSAGAVLLIAGALGMAVNFLVLTLAFLAVRWLIAPKDWRGRFRRWRKVGIVLVSLAAIALVGVIGLNLWMNHRDAQAALAWNRIGVDLESFPKRFPARRSNESALTLERLAAPLGIELGWERRPGRPEPPARPKSDKDASESLIRFIHEELGSSTDERTTLPAEAGRYLETHRRDLDEIRDALLGGALPEWESDFQRILESPTPGGVGQLRLQNLLLGAALEASNAGDGDGAIRYVEASVALNRSLRSRPDWLSQLIAIAVTRRQAGTIRKTGIILPEWRSRLRLSDIKEEFLTAMEGEIWRVIRLLRDVIEVRGQLQLHPGHNLLESPLQHWLSVQVSERGSGEIRRLREADGCAINAEAFDKQIAGKVPFPWDLSLQKANDWKRCTRVLIDLELTEKLLALREQHTATGKWPARLPDGDGSTICASERFAYRPLPDDKIQIALDPPIAEVNPYAFHLSQEYRGR
jgi:hypothetical protein